MLDGRVNKRQFRSCNEAHKLLNHIYTETRRIRRNAQCRAYLMFSPPPCPVFLCFLRAPVVHIFPCGREAGTSWAGAGCPREQYCSRPAYGSLRSVNGKGPVKSVSAVRRAGNMKCPQDAGKLISTIRPPSGAFLACTEPSWRRTAVSVIARPMPVPPIDGPVFPVR